MRILLGAMAAKSVALIAVLFLMLSVVLLVASGAHGETSGPSCPLHALKLVCGQFGEVPPSAGAGETSAAGGLENARAEAERLAAEMAAADKLAAEQSAAKAQGNEKQGAPEAPAGPVAPTIAPVAPAAPPTSEAATAEPSVEPVTVPTPISDSAWPTYTATTSASQSSSPTASVLPDTATSTADLNTVRAGSSGPNLWTILLILAAAVVVAGGTLAIYMLNRANAGRH
ncbi:hypothetical protein [Paenarthrobacter sp. PH39-S1]|uniref:hypothetical protein n=1 Tax=Paenarthrobacter sp. PH39-S1 TaxID=3046204 RepID=UPI0024BA6D52|nr:hypothetical protein [Paenarthrobacter sp. PH39-S1]MDJ0358175.1 hypothetical protein [Paenarthrobacter sp. PH39-S1]